MNSVYRYYIRIVAAIGLDKRELVSSILAYLQNNPELYPQAWGLDELCRRDYNEESAAALPSLSITDEFTIKRREKLKYRMSFNLGYDTNVVIDNFRTIEFEVHKFATDEQMNGLFQFLVELCQAELAIACGADEWFNDHLLTWRRIDASGNSSVIERLVGLDCPPKLPGIYWRTYISYELSKKIGLELTDLASLKGLSLEEKEFGFIIIPFRELLSIGSEEARQKQQSVREQIGLHHFFQKSDWHTLTNPWGLSGVYVMQSDE